MQKNPEYIFCGNNRRFFLQKKTFNQTRSWNYYFWQIHQWREMDGCLGNLTAVPLRKWLGHFTASPAWINQENWSRYYLFQSELSWSLFNRIIKLCCWFLTKKLGNIRSRVANFTSKAITQSRSKTFFWIGNKILWSSHLPTPQYFSWWRIESFSCFGRKGGLGKNFFTIITNMKKSWRTF